MEVTNNIIQSEEIDVIKKLERGPSEADLRRREAVEIDDDEKDERLENLKKQTLKLVSNSSGISINDQKRLIRENKLFLNKLYQDKTCKNIIEDDMVILLQRIYQYKLNRESLKSKLDSLIDLIEHPDDPEDEIKENNTKKETLIYVSDSDDDSTDNDSITIPISKPIKQIYNNYNLLSSVDVLKQKLLEKKRLLLNSNHQNTNVSAKAALMISLRQKVKQAANENYCIDAKIKNFDLKLRLQISDKCRQLIELIKLDEERKEAIETQILEKRRLENRMKFYENAKEDDGEFNEDYENNFEEILTEEARLAILSEFQRQNDNNNDEDEEEVDDEVDDDIEINDEVDTAAEPETENDNDSHVDSAENIKNVDDYNDKNADENLESNYDIEENIVNDIQPTKNIQRNKFVISDDNHEMTDTNIITNIVTNSDITNDDDTQLMDDNDNEIVVTMESVNEESKPKTVKDPMMKNALYRLQLLEEERRNKKEKSRNNSLLELEAEEEEEEGQQAGLGDFGFTFTKKDELDEIDALKLRKGDLDHIVDDVSDDEGDEEAGLKARLEQQEKEEKAKTRAIITAITEGHDTAKRLRNNKNIMSFNQLVGDDDEQIVNKIYDQENNNTTNDDDLDEEELLLRGLENRKNRDEQMKLYRSEFDEYDEEDEEEEEYMNTQDLENMTEEEKLIEYNKQKLRLEKKRISNLKRKQFEDLCKMRRALRRAQSLTQNDNQPLSSYLPAPSIVLTLDENQYNNDSYEETANSQNKSIKRRTFQQPKQFDKSNNKLLQRSNTVSTLQPLSDRTNIINNPLKKKSSIYKGTIDEAEILGGYGMGMAVTASNTRRNNIANKPTVGLFAAATDIRSNTSLKRTFSNISKRNNNTTGISLNTQQQYVFINNDENSQSVNKPISYSTTNPLKRSNTVTNEDSQSNSLFHKLNQRTNTLKRTTSNTGR